MLRRFSYFIACFLLVLMPIQAFAAANMLVCNSMMKLNTLKTPINATACHEHVSDADDSATPSHAEDSAHQKPSCASACAHLCALVAITIQTPLTFAFSPVQAFDANHQDYTSVTLASLQRPPIAFI